MLPTYNLKVCHIENLSVMKYVALTAKAICLKVKVVSKDFYTLMHFFFAIIYFRINGYRYNETSGLLGHFLEALVSL